MPLDDLQDQYIPRDNNFYRDHYHQFILIYMGVVLVMLMMISLVIYQIYNRPLPQFIASQRNGQTRTLTAYDEPNLLPDTILRWASKAATTAYTFNFVNYNTQLLAARPYFTNDGWQDYLNSVSNLITDIVARQLFVNSIVYATPIISNQGPLPGKGYSWRIQIPFLVTWQSANQVTKRNFTVLITIVRVPTSVNPQGIGIDQFLMV